MKRFLVVAMLLFSGVCSYAQTSVANGNWNSTTTWSPATVPTATSTVNAKNNITLNSNISITTGTYRFGWTGTATSGTNVTDDPGGTAYTLTMTGGTLDVKSGTTTIEGAATVDNVNLSVRSGATLIVGGLTVENGSTILIEAGGILIVNGDYVNNNNGSGTTMIQGFVQVNGNYSAPNGSVEIGGAGALQTTGTITTSGSSDVFGSQNDCTTGPCSGAALTCGSSNTSYTNSVTGTTNLCTSSSTTLTSVTNAPSPTYQWQECTTCTTSPIGTYANIASGGTSSTYTTPVLTSTKYYRVVVKSGTCTSTSPITTVSVSSTPTTASATGTQTICLGSSASLNGNAPSVGAGSWSVTAGPNTSITQFNNTSSPTATFTPTLAGSYTLRWSIANSCGSSGSNVTVTVNGTPTTSSAGSNQTICVGNSATLAANNPAVGTGTWSITSGPNTSTSQFGNTASNTSSFTPATNGTYVLTWTISNSPCTASASNVTITVNAAPTTANAGSAQSVCAGNSVTLAANNPTVGTGAWTVVSGPNLSTTQFGNTASNTSSFTPTMNGNYTLRWTISSGSCTASAADVVITRNGTPTTANAGSAQTICFGTSATLAANTPSVGTGAWSIVSGGTGSFSSTSSPTSTFTPDASGSYALRWTISNSPCTASTSNVTITVNSAPTTSVAGTNQTLCFGSVATLAANTPSVGTGAWSIVSGGTGTFGNTSSPVSTFTPNASGSYVLRWTISNSGCTSSASDVTITFNSAPTAANAGSNQTICAGSSVTLAANTPTTGVGAWSIVLGGTGAFGNAASAASTFTPNSSGSYVLRWTISNSPCTASTSDVTITVSGTPTVANAGSDQAICIGNAATLTGNTPTTGAGAWSIVSGGTGTFGSMASATSSFTPNATGTYILRWTISNSPCNASSSDVTIIVNAGPTTAAAGTDQTICEGTSATLAANTPSLGTASWSVVSGANFSSTQFSDASDPAAVFTPSASGVYTLRWTISNSCSSSTSDVSITVGQKPVINTSPSAYTICDSNTTSIVLTADVPASFSWTIGTTTGSVTGASAGTGNTIAQTLNNGGPSIGTVQYIVSAASNTGSCPSAATQTITVTVVPPGILLWTGNANINWSDPANWSCGIVPTSAYDVLIPSGSTVTVDANASARAINITAGSTLTIGSGIPLSVGGDFVNNGTFNGGISGAVTVAGNFVNNGSFNAQQGTIGFSGSAAQTIDAKNAVFYKIDVNKTTNGVTLISALQLGNQLTINSATDFASNGFLEILSLNNLTANDGAIGPLPTGASVSGDVKVNRAIVAAGLINRYISVPVKSVTPAQMSDDFKITSTSIRYYNEPTAGVIGNGYLNFPLTSTFEIGRGYLAYMYNNVNTTLDVTGKIHSGAFDYKAANLLKYTPTSGGASADGWNLLGNPYPSGVKFDLNNASAWSYNLIDPVISVPDLSKNSAYPNYYWSYNGVDGSGDLPGGIIAMGQAFWVHATSANSALTIKEQAKVAPGGGKFYREKSKYTSEQLKISINNGLKADNSFFKLNPDATPDFDVFDGYKMFNPEMNVYLLDDASRSLVMHTLKDVTDADKIRIAIEVAEPGTYNLTISNEENFKYGSDLVLVDTYTAQAIPVSEVKNLAFTVTSGRTTLTDRFYLTINKSEVKRIEQTILVYPNPVKDLLKIRAAGSASVELMHQNGKLISTIQFNDEDAIDMSSLAPGLYLLKIKTDGGVEVKKVVKE